MTRAQIFILELLAMLAAAVAMAAAAPAQGWAEELAIEKAGSAQFPERAYTLETPDRVALAPSEVVVRENGEPIESLTVESAAAGGGASFGTVLVIDASESMEGSAIVEAMRAARTFADRRAEGQRLGVVTFNDAPDVLLPMTADGGEINEALAQTPPLASSTHLYDATDVALEMLDAAGVEAGSIVVISDGADTGSDIASAEVIERAAGGGVRIFAVGLRSRQFDLAELEHLAIGGSVADAASPEDLSAIFDRFGAQLASEHLVRYESLAAPGDTVTVEVEVAGVAGVAQAYYAAPGAGTPGRAKADDGFWRSAAAMGAAIALAAALLGFALFIVFRPHRETVRDRLLGFIYAHRLDSDEDSGNARGVVIRGPLARLAPTFDRRDSWVKLEEQLEIASIQTPAVRIAAATLVATGIIALLVAQALNAAILVPLALLVPLGVRMWIKRRLRLQRREFAEQLADNLQLVASSLRAGQSMAGALAVVVEEASDPARREFRRIVNDERLGVPLEDAIRDVARRMDNRDLEQVALVATIQREAGGNTAEILDQVTATIRERGKLRRLMETLTAQGRLTQIIVSAVPFVLLIAVALVNREYLDPLLETSSGRIALAIGLFLSVAGSLIIKRIVEVRV